jgi:Fic family protein
MRIEAPKDISVSGLIEKFSVEEVFSCMGTQKPIDEKGRYLHWDEVRRRKDQYSQPELAWFAIKSARRPIYKEIPLIDVNGKPLIFCVPDSLQCLLHQVDKMAAGNIGAVDTNIVSKQTQHRYLVQSLIMDEAITSAQLEGAATTRKVAKEMLKSERAPRNKSERMIVNNYQMMRTAVEAKDQPLTMELILELHEIATNGAIDNDAEPGVFRDSDDVVVKFGGETVFTPPLAESVPERVAALCHFAETDHANADSNEFIHPVVKAIILHFMMGYIHPFGDGNGRSARALFYWFMLKSGYWLFEYVSISQLLRKAPSKYVKSYIYTETDEGDLTYFIDYQLHVVVRAIEELITHLKEKQKSYYDFVGLLEGSDVIGGLKPRQVDILKRACREPGRLFTAEFIGNEYAISLNTARADLEKLAELKLLLLHKEGKRKCYIAPSDLMEKITG